MRLKFLRSSATAGLTYAVLIYALAFVLYTVARADELKYFDSEIDYWKTKQSAAKVDSTSKESDKPPLKREKFVWEKFLNPNNPEFFKEGEYSPPEPFMEIVRNPTDENLKNWFAYIDKRNDLYKRLEGRIQEYHSPESRVVLQQRFSKISKFDSDVKRYRFRFYFDSTCPHCKKMKQTMNQLIERGYLVEGVQTDSGPMESLPFSVRRASKVELSEKSVSSVPLLLVGDLKKKIVLRLSGYQSLENVVSALGQNASL